MWTCVDTVKKMLLWGDLKGSWLGFELPYTGNHIFIKHSCFLYYLQFNSRRYKWFVFVCRKRTLWMSRQRLPLRKNRPGRFITNSNFFLGSGSTFYTTDSPCLPFWTGNTQQTCLLTLLDTLLSFYDFTILLQQADFTHKDQSLDAWKTFSTSSDHLFHQQQHCCCSSGVISQYRVCAAIQPW